MGEWDMCRNGQYTEGGIKEIDGLLRNNFVVGSVNANKRHWHPGGRVLAHADPA